jgi:Holliday junction resolvasome RuvABC endonuclease subunit
MREKLRVMSLSLVCIERPMALHNPKANVSVLQCAWVGGELAGWIRHQGIEVVEVGPEAWRMALIGRPRAGTNRDKLVAQVLAARVSGIPDITSVHARDALGAALVGWEMWARGAA